MQKIYILLAAAMCASSAYAAHRDVAVAKNPVQLGAPTKVGLPAMAKPADMTQLAKKVMRAESANGYAFYRPADNMMNIGMNTEGRYYKGVGFASSHGDMEWTNHSIGLETYNWDYFVADFGAQEWIPFSSQDQDLSLKAHWGEIQSPVLTGTTGDFASSYQENTQCYYIGGSAGYWLGDYSYGLTFFKNMGCQDDNGYSFSLTTLNSYDSSNAGGAIDGWAEELSRMFADCEATDIKDIEIENFTITCPKPNSPYIMSTGWIYVSTDISGSTTLTSHIYPMDDLDNIDYEHPIALGTCELTEGNYFPFFNYNALDQEGNPTDEMIIIDSAIAVTIEGFLGNENVRLFTPVSGLYPFNAADWRGESTGEANPYLCPKGDLYLGMNFTIEGVGRYSNYLVQNPYLYYMDNNRTKLSSLNYSTWTMDAQFPYIFSVDGVDDVLFPEEGGETEVTLNSYFYDVKAWVEEGLMTVDAPEWLEVEFSEPTEDYLTVMTLRADKADQIREGYVRISGMASSYELPVKQDAKETGVSVMDASNGTVYYDLTGRRVMNPEKGVYIVKEGKRTYKTVK